MMAKRFFIGVVCFLLLGVALKAGAISYSDLGLNEFEKGPEVISSLSRNPFIPSVKSFDVTEISNLYLQGVVFSADKAAALISGRVVKRGDYIGNYEVTEINPNHVTMRLNKSVYALDMEVYFHRERKPLAPGCYIVELYEANLRLSLDL